MKDCITGEELNASKDILYECYYKDAEGCIQNGVTKHLEEMIPIFDMTHKGHGSRKDFKDWQYDNSCGFYRRNANNVESLVKGRGNFPYPFNRAYEAVNLFDKYKDKQKLLYPIKPTILSKYLKYTIGLEYETSCGYVPNNLAVKSGLIPLRDGSIQGLEYSTTVMLPSDADKYIYQQMLILRKYTNFDKECSLHIHFGNTLMTKNFVLRLWQLCCSLQNFIPIVTHRAVFNTASYKRTGKNYCTQIAWRGSFADIYQDLTGKPFKNWTDPHPNDMDRDRKWEIPQRYHWLNLINLLCYKVNKTVEFRFLNPTYSYPKVILWIMILNGILLYTSDTRLTLKIGGISDIFRAVYPAKIASYINMGINLLQLNREYQEHTGDNCGQNLREEDNYFNYLIPMMYDLG